MGSDVVHDTELGAAMLQALDACLAPGGTGLIINPAAEHRYGVEKFHSLLIESGWLAKVEDVTEDLLQDVDDQGLRYEIWEITRSGD
mmetsp:Transcript_7972/g.16568  ORF Transcript_7972/g.16568 Transcript_7972/m.16568 type:complete len:87 (+) Transcript_7972:1-261(+)